MKWNTPVKVKKIHIEIYTPLPPPINIHAHTHIPYPNMARFPNKEITWTHTLKNKEINK